jgi:beta-glucanase (GH16 family)
MRVPMAGAGRRVVAWGGSTRPRRPRRAAALVAAGVIAATNVPPATVASAATATAARAAATVAPAVPRPVGVPGAWKLLWHDEFDGRTLDPAKWTRGWPGWCTTVLQPTNAYETACYDPANATVPGDGSLHLVLTAKTQGCGGVTRTLAGASVVSRGRFQYAYGVAQARVFLPGAPGSRRIANWPNFWGNATSLRWPADGENDTFEGLRGQACWHFHSNAGGPGACTTVATPGWHVVASDWEPGRVTYYYDGHRVGAVTNGVTGRPQYLAFQLTQSPAWGGPLALNQPYRVDYVRVWQHR